MPPPWDASTPIYASKESMHPTPLALDNFRGIDVSKSNESHTKWEGIETVTRAPQTPTNRLAIGQ